MKPPNGHLEIHDSDTGEMLSHLELEPYKVIEVPKWLVPGKVYHTHLLNTDEWAILQQDERGYWYTSPMPKGEKGD